MAGVSMVCILAVFAMTGYVTANTKDKPKQNMDKFNCSLGNAGDCVTGVKNTCPVGSTCVEIKPGSTKGKCCFLYRLLPEFMNDKSNEDGEPHCYGYCFADAKCKPGYFCVLQSNRLWGSCCTNKRE